MTVTRLVVVIAPAAPGAHLVCAVVGVVQAIDNPTLGPRGYFVDAQRENQRSAEGRKCFDRETRRSLIPRTGVVDDRFSGCAAHADREIDGQLAGRGIEVM